MPFTSQAQRGWMFENHPEMAHEWAKETPDIQALPERKKSKKKKSTAEPQTKAAQQTQPVALPRVSGANSLPRVKGPITTQIESQTLTPEQLQQQEAAQKAQQSTTAAPLPLPPGINPQPAIPLADRLGKQAALRFSALELQMFPKCAESTPARSAGANREFAVSPGSAALARPTVAQTQALKPPKIAPAAPLAASTPALGSGPAFPLPNPGKGQIVTKQARLEATQSGPVHARPIKDMQASSAALQSETYSALPSYDDSVLSELQQIQQESDRKNYSAKYAALRKLITAYPQDFEIAPHGPDPRMVGVRHTPTGFQFHIPGAAVPWSFPNTEKTSQQQVPQGVTLPPILQQYAQKYQLKGPQPMLPTKTMIGAGPLTNGPALHTPKNTIAKVAMVPRIPGVPPANPKPLSPEFIEMLRRWLQQNPLPHGPFDDPPPEMIPHLRKYRTDLPPDMPDIAYSGADALAALTDWEAQQPKDPGLRKVSSADALSLPDAPTAAIEPAVPTRKRTYVGEGARLDVNRLNSLIRQFETRTGADLSKMPVLVGTQQYWRNLGRYYIPKTLSQVPSRLGRLATSVYPDLLEYHLDRVGRLSGIEGSHYNLAFGTVNAAKNAPPGELAHEIGHWADLESNQGPYKRRLLGGHDAPTGNRELDEELSATLFARKALGSQWRNAKDHLTAAFGTYMVGQDTPRRTFMEWLKRHPKIEPDPNWRKTLATVLQSPDVQAKRRAFRQALAHLQTLEVKNPIIEVDEDANKVRWAKPGSKKDGKMQKELQDMIGTLFDSEYNRLYGAGQQPTLQKAAAFGGLLAGALAKKQFWFDPENAKEEEETTEDGQKAAGALHNSVFKNKNLLEIGAQLIAAGRL